MQASRRGMWSVSALIAISIIMVFAASSTVWAEPEACSCPFVGDVTGDGESDIVDLVNVIEGALHRKPLVTDSNCPKPREDINADGLVDGRDILHLADYFFVWWSTPPPPVNPCDCAVHPEWCAQTVDPDPGAPGNSVVIESKTVVEGEQDVVIHVMIANDVPIRQVVIPLIVRSITPGSYITSIQGSRSGRSVGVLGNFSAFHVFYEPNGACGPGGFGTATFLHKAITPSPVRPMATSPDGLLIAAGSMDSVSSPVLAPGVDAEGSYRITVDVTSTSGMFEIDTACVDPANHLMFVQDDVLINSPLVPSFTKGVITIVPNSPPVAQCTDVLIDVGTNCQNDASVDNGSYDPDGGPVTITVEPPGPYPLGVTQVTLIAEDVIGAKDSCAAVVTVQDNFAPEIACPASVPVPIGPDDTGAVVSYFVSATDNCSGVTVVCTPPSDSYFPRGLTPVVCVATDNAGLADTCTFSVVLFTECFDRLSDVNCDGNTNIVDVVTLIDVAFRGGPQPPPCTTNPNR